MIEITQDTLLALSLIRIDGGTQTRAELNYDTVQDYTQSMMEGAEFPPVKVFYDGSDYWLADGFHRYFAAKQLCRETIEADIKQGTRRDAVLYSVGCNTAHGLRRTNADKRRAVETLLRDEEWRVWSDNRIAKQCGISQPFVSKLRADLSYNDYKIEPRKVERNGTIYTMNTANIKQQQQPESEVQQQNLTREEFLDEEFPGFTAWQKERTVESVSPDSEIEEDEGNEREMTEEDRYSLAVDTGTTEYYHEDLRREAIARDKEKRDAHVMRVMGSSDSPEWYTPQEIIDLVCQMFIEIDTDPCSNSHETPVIPAHTLYTKEDNGLLQTWKGKTYLNPPYGAEISQWTDKLIFDYKQGHVEEALALLPARIDTAWFSPLYEFLMCNVRGRIQYANSPYSAPFPCVVVYLGKREDEFIRVFKNLGPIMRRIAG